MEHKNPATLSLDAGILNAYLRGHDEAPLTNHGAKPPEWAANVLRDPSIVEARAQFLLRRLQSDTTVRHEIINPRTTMDFAHKCPHIAIMLDCNALTQPFLGEMLSDLTHRLEKKGATCAIAIPAEVLYLMTGADGSDDRTKERRSHLTRTENSKHPETVVSAERLETLARLEHLEEVTGKHIIVLPPAELGQFQEPHTDFKKAIAAELRSSFFTHKACQRYERSLARYRENPATPLSDTLPNRQRQINRAYVNTARKWHEILGKPGGEDGWMDLSLKDPGAIPDAALLKTYDILKMEQITDQFGFDESWKKKLKDLGEDALGVDAITLLGKNEKVGVIAVSNDYIAREKFDDISKDYGGRMMTLTSRELALLAGKFNERAEAGFSPLFTPAMLTLSMHHGQVPVTDAEVPDAVLHGKPHFPSLAKAEDGIRVQGSNGAAARTLIQ